jgi:hypothetical protein
VHDSADLESRGVPTVFIATEPFVDGAEAQARALGVEPIGVFVPHPIQDRTNDEVRVIADEAVAKIVNGLTTGGISFSRN